MMMLMQAEEGTGGNRTVARPAVCCRSALGSSSRRGRLPQCCCGAFVNLHRVGALSGVCCRLAGLRAGGPSLAAKPGPNSRDASKQQKSWSQAGPPASHARPKGAFSCSCVACLLAGWLLLALAAAPRKPQGSLQVVKRQLLEAA